MMEWIKDLKVQFKVEPTSFDVVVPQQAIYWSGLPTTFDGGSITVPQNATSYIWISKSGSLGYSSSPFSPPSSLSGPCVCIGSVTAGSTGITAKEEYPTPVGFSLPIVGCCTVGNLPTTGTVGEFMLVTDALDYCLGWNNRPALAYWDGYTWRMVSTHIRITDKKHIYAFSVYCNGMLDRLTSISNRICAINKFPVIFLSPLCLTTNTSVLAPQKYLYVLVAIRFSSGTPNNDKAFVALLYPHGVEQWPYAIWTVLGDSYSDGIALISLGVHTFAVSSWAGATAYAMFSDYSYPTSVPSTAPSTPGAVGLIKLPNNYHWNIAYTDQSQGGVWVISQETVSAYCTSVMAYATQINNVRYVYIIASDQTSLRRPDVNPLIVGPIRAFQGSGEPYIYSGSSICLSPYVYIEAGTSHSEITTLVIKDAVLGAIPE